MLTIYQPSDMPPKHAGTALYIYTTDEITRACNTWIHTICKSADLCTELYDALGYNWPCGSISNKTFLNILDLRIRDYLKNSVGTTYDKLLKRVKASLLTPDDETNRILSELYLDRGDLPDDTFSELIIHALDSSTEESTDWMTYNFITTTNIDRRNVKWACLPTQYWRSTGIAIENDDTVSLYKVDDEDSYFMSFNIVKLITRYASQIMRMAMEDFNEVLVNNSINPKEFGKGNQSFSHAMSLLDEYISGKRDINNVGDSDTKHIKRECHAIKSIASKYQVLYYMDDNDSAAEKYSRYDVCNMNLAFGEDIAHEVIEELMSIICTDISNSVNDKKEN